MYVCVYVRAMCVCIANVLKVNNSFINIFIVVAVYCIYKPHTHTINYYFFFLFCSLFLITKTK